MSVSNFILAYKILRDISTKWIDFPAYSLGLIDDRGVKLKSPSTPEEKEAYDSYWKMLFNFKRILQRFVGKNNIVQSIATAFLLKENVDEASVKLIVEKLQLRDFEKPDEKLLEMILEVYSDEEPETEVEKIIYDKLKTMKWKSIKKHEYGDAYYANSPMNGKVMVEYSKSDKHFNVYDKSGKTLIRQIKSNK